MKKFHITPFLTVAAWCTLSTTSMGQVKDSTDLMAMLDQETGLSEANRTVQATFKATRVVNAHSIEQVSQGVLDVKIAHRFGTLNGGFYELFGLDNASTRIGADYGITRRLMVGLGRSSVQKQYDAFAKYRVLQQSSGEKALPFSVSLLAGIYLQTLKWPDDNAAYLFAHRLDYLVQVLIARKFSERLSLQLSPGFIHQNLVTLESDPNNSLHLGISGRVKLTRRISLNGEYFLLFQKSEGVVPPLSIGFDIETGGHVFQLMFTNAVGIAENQYIAKSTGKWTSGDIHFGFNISRVFSIGKKK